VTEKASFIDDLGADSLDNVELVMAFEEEFDIEIPDDAAEHIQMVGDAVVYRRAAAWLGCPSTGISAASLGSARWRGGFVEACTCVESSSPASGWPPGRGSSDLKKILAASPQYGSAFAMAGPARWPARCRVDGRGGGRRAQLRPDHEVAGDRPRRRFHPVASPPTRP
jgi:hypothetical protein